MKNHIRYFGTLLFLCIFTAVQAQNALTPRERQEIAVETPGLFKKSDAFTVDFVTYSPRDYCFPLPRGTARKGKDNSLKIEADAGDGIKAMFDGVVRMATRDSELGGLIVVRHDNGLESVYGRCSEVLVKSGETVQAGQTIAIVGGEGDRVFCEFAIMVNGCRINPAIIISPKSHRLLQQTLMFRKRESDVEITVVSPDRQQDQERKEEKELKRQQELKRQKELKEQQELMEQQEQQEQQEQNEQKEQEEQKKQKKQQIAVKPAADPFAGGRSFTIDLAAIPDNEWHYPLPGGRVISPYGKRGGRLHAGTDIKTRPNDSIIAAFDGVVVMSKYYSGYGNCIILRHANGLETLYGHNSKNLVEVGDEVKAGQVIALTGRTGRATTEHLHFEVRVGRKTYNSTMIFDHKERKLKKEKVTFKR